MESPIPVGGNSGGDVVFETLHLRMVISGGSLTGVAILVGDTFVIGGVNLK